MCLGYNCVRCLRFICVFFTVFSYSQGEGVLFAVSDKRVLSQALVTEKLNLFSLAGLHLSCIFYFCFVITQCFSYFNMGGGKSVDGSCGRSEFLSQHPLSCSLKLFCSCRSWRTDTLSWYPQAATCLWEHTHTHMHDNNKINLLKCSISVLPF